MTTAEEYNGWTNIETWNTALWLGNHSKGMEQTVLRIMRGRNKLGFGGKVRDANGHIYQKPITSAVFADNLETYVGIIWGDKTPDGHSLKPVNWVEIAESWIEAYQP